MATGLKQHTVLLAPHDATWATLYDAEARALIIALGADAVAISADTVTLGTDAVSLGADTVALGTDAVAISGDAVTLGGAVAIEHVGSTSVPGLPAKPILDIALALADALTAPTIDRLTAIGYIDCGDKGGDGGHLLVKESSPGVRTVHLHVVAHGDDNWRAYMIFRDALRRCPPLRDAYAALKRHLAAQLPDDRPRYTASKHGFIQSVMRAAELAAPNPVAPNASRVYAYVGPVDLLADATPDKAGHPISCAEDLRRWLRERGDRPDPEGQLTLTFVVDLQGRLLIADRHSEHVSCASGGPVLAAGELVVLRTPDPEIAEASNQSTGYCPEPDCWTHLQAALDRANIPHPGRLTRPFTFRRCPECGQRNIIKDSWFECDVCANPLPLLWNFG